VRDLTETPSRHRPIADGISISWPGADEGPSTGWPHRHLLDVDQLTRAELEECLDLAVEMRDRRNRGETPSTLRGEVVGLAFCEPSTRTRVSFELAATALGAQVVNLPIEASSVTKGESLVERCGRWSGPISNRPAPPDERRAVLAAPAVGRHRQREVTARMPIRQRSSTLTCGAWGARGRGRIVGDIGHCAWRARTCTPDRSAPGLLAGPPDW
jgi:hypothetical protein